MPLIHATNYLKLMFEVGLRKAFASATTPDQYKYTADENTITSKIRIYRNFPDRNFNPPALVVTAETGDVSLQYLGKEVVKEVYGVGNETVVNNTLSQPPIVAFLTLTDGGSTTYVEGTDFNINKKTGVITWIIPQPVTAVASYGTFNNIVNVTDPVGKWVQSQVQIPVKITIYALSNTDRERITDLVLLYVRHVFRPAFSAIAQYIKISLGGETEEDWKNAPLYKNTVTVDCWSQYSNYIDQSTFALIEQINVTNIDVEAP